MIKRILYQNIDFSKYEICVENSVQKNFYARKEILDHLCDTWELLILGDYEYVMPIPIRRKYGVKVVIMPLFCQQLGVFSSETNPSKEQAFLKFLSANYRVAYYAFNHQNSFVDSLKLRKNYFIEKTEYTLLRKAYFKGRKSTVKVAQYLQFKEIPLAEELNFIQNNFKGLEKKGDLAKFFNYLNFLEVNHQLRIFASYKENSITNAAIIISQDNSFSLLGLINHEDFKQDNGASFLIDKILKDYIQEKLFNFMGSSIRGIEVFFKSFGSQLQEYAVVENSKLDLVKNIFKK